MSVQRFGLSAQTLAIVELHGRLTTAYIPPGDVVTVTDNPLGGVGFVDVDWNGVAATIFATDLRERGNIVRTVGE